MILLDTNVVSEPMRPEPDAAVMDWFSAQTAGDIYISAITEAELRAGVAVLPEGRRRQRLSDAIEAMLVEEFGSRVVPFAGGAISSAYAEIVSTRRRFGRPISMADAMIGAIAKAGQMVLVTRNVRDFDDLGVQLLDPWNAR